MRRYQPRTGHFGGEIIVNGQPWQCDAPVLTPDDHGLRFNVGHGARRRHSKQVIDLVVLHWTGSESSAPTVHRQLTSRALGVEFVVDRQAVIWQFADPAMVDTFDAGYVNRRSAGIEIVNYGFASRGKSPPRAGENRPRYKTELHGRRRTFASFYPAQVQATVALLETLRRALPCVFRRVPKRNGQLITDTMSKAQVQNFSGVLGHFHVSKNKSDPGTDIFEALIADGY